MVPGAARGHVEVGCTLACMLVIGLVALVSYQTGTYSLGGLWDLWLEQPGWIQVLAIAIPVGILGAGRLFERAGRWPKLPPDDSP